MAETSTEITDKIEKPWLFQKGVSGNPAGKPVGAKNKITVIGTIEQMFVDDPLMFLEFVNKYLKDPRNRQHIVEMIDGKPKGSSSEITLNIALIQQAPTIQSIVDESTREAVIDLFNREFGGETEKIIAHNYYKEHREEFEC